jgi:hypothetical protein
LDRKIQLELAPPVPEKDTSDKSQTENNTIKYIDYDYDLRVLPDLSMGLAKFWIGFIDLTITVELIKWKNILDIAK